MAYKPKYRKKLKLLPKLLTASTVLFTCLLLVALGMVVKDVLRSQQDQQAFQELAQLVQVEQTRPENQGQAPEDPGNPTAATEPPSPYQVLHEKNPDFAAWLTVPGTAIDYPVVHTPQDADRYIYKAFDGSESPSGTPFVGDYGDLDSQKCIIYGHNMKDGTMFHDLLKYEKKSFWQENPTFTINTLEGERNYEIFSAVRTRVLETGESGLRFYRLPEGVVAWLVEKSLYSTDIVPTEEDTIVILSTCSYHTDEGRFIIAGRLVEQ